LLGEGTDMQFKINELPAYGINLKTGEMQEFSSEKEMKAFLGIEVVRPEKIPINRNRKKPVDSMVQIFKDSEEENTLYIS
jgi:hypothetical protein